MAPAGLLESFLAAIQASLSVLLVISYGGIAAWLNLLDHSSTKAISKICVRMFLPALLITKIGSELHSGSARRYAIIFAWALICHFISFLIGIFGHLVLKMPDWVTVAVMFNNTTSYPLLLVTALDETGILSSLMVGDETTKDAIERAKSYFLVFATVSSCLTFAVGPRLIDSEHPPEPEHKDEDEGGHGVEGIGREPNEGTGLLNPGSSMVRFADPFSTSNGFFPSTRSRSIAVSPGVGARRTVSHDNRRAPVVPKHHWVKLGPRAKWWLLFISDFFNAPLLGAIVGVVIGLVPALQRAFFNDTQDGGIFTAWLTASLKNIGNLFVPLPVVIAGVSLFTSMRDARRNHESWVKLPWGTLSYILIVRFILWPVASIGVIYAFASKTDFLGTDDPMLWFAMMLMPTGPSAMKLISLVQVSQGEEEEEANIAKLLTISYIISPILSFTVVGSLLASQASIR
ncbi:auxin efflux carrier [Diplogelasinospora grovesii]|uniref:Auxin efflux carrier n=1 Tax=Diplogelasinospora grovesii TaxID=303347 RepID=A0AAN6MWY3_9PEZI|nr:auxin efflux carrier [Diplogelasinospora grovesii]